MLKCFSALCSVIMDQISNMLITIKNGSFVERETVLVPFSKLRQSIVDCLVKEGFLVSSTKANKNGIPHIQITLKYTDGKAKVNGVKRISKPSRRVYMGFDEIRPVKQGHGLLILSTPKGIMTGKEARKELVGGEALFQIW